MSWPRVPLGEVATSVESGFACGKSNLVDNGLPHLRPFNVTTEGNLGLAEVYQVPAELVPASKSSLLEGDLLFNNTNSRDLVGKCAYVGSDLIAGFSNHMTRVRLDRSRCEPQFVRYQLHRLWRSGFFRDNCTQWVSQAAFGPRMLAGVSLPLPPLEEQRRIVEVLNRTASVERLRARADAALSAFAPALFIKMFGDPVENPMGWEVRPLGDLLDGIAGGWSPKCGDGPLEADQWGVLKLSAVTGGYYNPDEVKVLRDDSEPRPEIEVRAGDILFSRKNTRALVGACAWVEGTPERRMFPDTVFRLDPLRNAIAPGYLWSVLSLRQMRPSIEALATGAAASMVNISKGRLRTLLVPVPPLPLQTRYAELVATARGVAATAETATTAAASLSAALMSRLFEDAA